MKNDEKCHFNLSPICTFRRDQQWTVFTGNEIGALLGWWSLRCFKLNNPDVKMADCFMMASTVSSKILKAMAKQEGFNFVETLTGFKWMGNKAIELMEQGKHVLFAYEEAIGFMVTPTVLDKDGVSAGGNTIGVVLLLMGIPLFLTQKTASIALIH